jgi:hypothetical protein
MKTTHFAAFAGVAVTLAAVTVVGTALSDPPRLGGNPNPSLTNVAVAYPKVTLSCAGTGIPAPKIQGEKGWPNPPIATMKLCTSATDCYVTNTPCWPYSCDTSTKACRTSCADSSDCGALGACVGGQCQPHGSYCTTGRFQMKLDGTMGNTYPFSCNPETGVAYATCASGLDCANNLTCSSTGQCRR